MSETPDPPTTTAEDADPWAKVRAANQINNDRDQLVNEYLDTQAAIEKHMIMLGQLADRIVDEFGIGGRHEIVPGVGIRVQKPVVTFNAAQAKRVLTDDQYRSICEAKPSAKLAHDMLPGRLVELCSVSTGKPSVRAL